MARTAENKERSRPTAAQLVPALNHPLRRAILRQLQGRETTSATQISRTISSDLGCVSYHVQVLDKLVVLNLVERVRVRGASEKLYRACPLEEDAEWVGTVLERTRALDGA